MDNKNNPMDAHNGVPMYVPALLLGSIPILIAGRFIPQTMPHPSATTREKQMADMPVFMPGGGSFPFPESE